MAIDPLTLQSTADAADLERIANDFPKRLWNATFPRFRERSARIDLARMVRDEEIVVPIPDRLISDEDTDFVAYIAPERKTLESGMRQSLEENPSVYQKIPLSGEDGDIKRADMAEAFANALREAIVPWDSMVGKAVEDGEFGVTILYDLSDFQAAPLPSDVLSEKAYKKLPETEQADWTEVRRSGGRVRYSRYKARYWRDAEGRDKNDKYYRDRQDDGTRRAFERNVLATRRAWKEHAKSWKAGYVPLNVEVVSALDGLPLLTKGNKDQRWTCRGLVKRKRYEIDDCVSRGLTWTGLGGDMYPRSFDASTGTSRLVWLYEAWVYLEDEDGELVPCVVYCVDGCKTEQMNDRTGNYEPAIVNLKDEYGLTTLPANYFFGAHTEADDPDKYAFPAMYPLLSPILNQEGAITAYQVHMRKYGMANRMGTTPNKDVPNGPYMNADTGGFDPDLDADIVLLPNPTFPLVMPPAPNAVKDMLQMYDRAIGSNAPSDALRGTGDQSDASGHSLTVQAGLSKAANSHILGGVRGASEWIGSTAVEMIDALQEKFPSVKVSVFPRQEVPGDASGKRKRSNALEFNAKDWNGNYTLRAYYPKVGNLAEIQQTADLADRGYASFDDVMEMRGKPSPFNERVKIAVDQFWKSPEGMKFMMLEALRRRGDMERATMLEKQTRQEMQPDGLPTAALAPEAQAVAQLGPPGQMAGVQLPNVAASALGGQVAGSMGTAQLQNESQSLSGIPMAAGAV